MSDPSEKPTVARFDVRLDDDDYELLCRLIQEEKLTKADVIRRALRAYAKALGVERKPLIAAAS